MIMNPNLVSAEMVGNFKSSNWVIENVITYYFENFLSAYERSIVSKELSHLKSENYRLENLKYLNLKNYFSSQKQFLSFSKALSLEKFIENTKINELRQAYSTNKEYDENTIEWVNHIYNSGIELFNSKTDYISQICFDHTGIDHAVFSIRENGVWEIPIKKSLINRNWQDWGLKVFDAEL